MKLIQEVKTYKNLKELLGELDTVLLEVSGKLEANLADILQEKAPQFGKVLADYLQENQAMNRKTAVTSLEKLRDQLDEVKVLELSVAVTPTDSMTSEIHNWIFNNVGQSVVVDFRKNPSLVAGAVISYNGKYGDFSTSKKIKSVVGRLKDAS